LLFPYRFAFFEAFPANTGKRQIPRFTQFIVAALLAREILAAAEAALGEAYVVGVKDFCEGVEEFFNVVGVGYAKSAACPVIF
jgi:hypothetical protein